MLRSIARTKGQRKRTVEVHLPAPVGGVNTVSPGTAMPPSDSILSWNLIGAEYGLRTRLGWREYCLGVGYSTRTVWAATTLYGAGAYVIYKGNVYKTTAGGTSGSVGPTGTGTGISDGGVTDWAYQTPVPVRSLLAFTGSTTGNNKLFACTTDGIYDVTSGGQTPTRVVAFGTVSSTSGYGVSTVMVNTGTTHYLLYCDEANGYYTYSESGAVWTASGLPANPVTGADPTKLVFVMVWKNRVWFVERDTGHAWYLPTGAVTGVATRFTFGTRFKAGGPLRGLWSWTYDGGSGIDDALVAISGGGDVLVYKGTDPAFASTFGLQGVWQVGTLPAGRRLCSENGGDLLIMSSLGILPMSKLVTGSSIFDRSQYDTYKIGNLFAQLQSDTANNLGWSMRIHPADAALLVVIPSGSTGSYQQLAMSLVTKGWHQYRGMPNMTCAEAWGGDLYFGTADGRVCINSGYVDGLLLSDPSAYTPIDFSGITSFQNGGSPLQKRIATVKARVISKGASIPLNVEARWGFDFTEAASPTGAPTSSGSAWDSATWDSSKFGGDYQPREYVFGAVGLGSQAALAFRGTVIDRAVVVGFDISFETGGLL